MTYVAATLALISTVSVLAYIHALPAGQRHDAVVAALSASLAVVYWGIALAFATRGGGR